MTTLTPIENDPTYKQGLAVTENDSGACGVIRDVWKDDAGNLHVAVDGPQFEGEIIPVAEVTVGGTPDLYEPTLDVFPLDRHRYELKNLAAPDGCVPPGWAVLYTPDSQYVAWGLPDRKTSFIYAIGHAAGISFLGRKF